MIRTFNLGSRKSTNSRRPLVGYSYPPSCQPFLFTVIILRKQIVKAVYRAVHCTVSSGTFLPFGHSRPVLRIRIYNAADQNWHNFFAVPPIVTELFSSRSCFIFLRTFGETYRLSNSLEFSFVQKPHYGPAKKLALLLPTAERTVRVKTTSKWIWNTIHGFCKNNAIVTWAQWKEKEISLPDTGEERLDW